MSIQNAYNQWSETYDSDRNRTRDLDQEVTRSRLEGLHFGSILEIGCGTGKNSFFLASLAGSLHAVDFSQGMIEKAREKVQADHVRFALMDITRPWEFENEAFDLVVCNLVLEHIRDLDHVFSEAWRTLRQKGRFFINELHPFRQYEGTKARFYKNEERIEVEAFVHHVSDYFKAAAACRLSLVHLDEYWHAEDQDKPPRILSLVFERR